MEEFEIPVTYKGQEHLFNARLATFTYGYKIYVDVNGVEIVLERDDAGNLRAMLPESVSDNAIEKGLIEAIIDVFNQL